jgi:predicted MPP superfamily phosphohydrolase
MFPLLLFLIAGYAALHVVFYRAVRAAFAPPRWLRLLLAVALAGLFCAPLITRLLDRVAHERIALLIGLPGYFWMCGLLWFCLLWLACWPVRRLARRWPAGAAACSAQRVFYTCVLSVLILGVIGWRESHALRVEEVHVACAHLPPGQAGLRIALFSDLHLDLHRNHRLLAQVAERLRALQPDLILSGGDLVDSPHCLPDAEQFAALSAPLGKFAVLGNHEYYLGLPTALAFHARAGLTLLRQRAVELAPGLWLAGVDNSAGRHFRQPCFDDERTALAAVPADACVLLLKHEPHFTGPLPADLILSGHTHAGQVFPFHTVVRARYPLLAGLHRLDARTQLYITRGTGTWGPPFRLGAPPELTLLILEPARP